MPEEPPRLLAARSELGYTTRPAEALNSEPEAIEEAEQLRQTRDAKLRADRRLGADWQRARSALERELAWLRTRPVGIALASELRVIERLLARIDRRFGC